MPSGMASTTSQTGQTSQTDFAAAAARGSDELDGHTITGNTTTTTRRQQMTGSTNDESLTIDVDDDGVIIVHGDIDMAGGPVLEAAMLRREDLDRDVTTGAQPLVIDLDDVSFIDSSGLRSLLGASRRARGRGTDVVLRRVGPEVARLLDITGTTSQFVIGSHRG